MGRPSEILNSPSKYSSPPSQPPKLTTTLVSGIFNYSTMNLHLLIQKISSTSILISNRRGGLSRRSEISGFIYLVLYYYITQDNGNHKDTLSQGKWLFGKLSYY